jgi:hypothetical protein
MVEGQEFTRQRHGLECHRSQNNKPNGEDWANAIFATSLMAGFRVHSKTKSILGARFNGKISSQGRSG